ncbi:hypothetical protein, partial [Streptomyces sp. NPDC052127]|uniref:hypothetical protein n=1 Tax=Streptomyces sp. NPDC052127 TaxID=3155679 RepID=UPI0034308F81
AAAVRGEGLRLEVVVHHVVVPHVGRLNTVPSSSGVGGATAVRSSRKGLFSTGVGSSRTAVGSVSGRWIQWLASTVAL